MPHRGTPPQKNSRDQRRQRGARRPTRPDGRWARPAPPADKAHRHREEAAGSRAEARPGPDSRWRTNTHLSRLHNGGAVHPNHPAGRCSALGRISNTTKHTPKRHVGFFECAPRPLREPIENQLIALTQTHVRMPGSMLNPMIQHIIIIHVGLRPRPGALAATI